MDPLTHEEEVALHYKNLRKGISLILLTWISFSILAALSRGASTKASIPTILFFQNLISFIFVLPWVIKNGKESLKTEKFGLIFVRTTCGVLGFGCLFLAVQRISLVNASLLNNTGPIFVPLIGALFFSIKINHKLWGSIILGFIGIAFILRPTAALFEMGSLYGLASGITLATSMLALRRLSFTERAHTVLFYYFGLSALLTFPFALYTWQTPDKTAWLEIIAIGLLSTGSIFAMTKAFHFAKASHLAPFNYSGVIFAGLIEWFFWGRLPDLYSLIGIILVTLGGILTILHTKPEKPSDSQ